MDTGHRISAQNPDHGNGQGDQNDSRAHSQNELQELTFTFHAVAWGATHFAHDEQVSTHRERYSERHSHAQKNRGKKFRGSPAETNHVGNLFRLPHGGRIHRNWDDHQGL